MSDTAAVSALIADVSRAEELRRAPAEGSVARRLEQFEDDVPYVVWRAMLPIGEPYVATAEYSISARTRDIAGDTLRAYVENIETGQTEYLVLASDEIASENAPADVLLAASDVIALLASRVRSEQALVRSELAKWRQAGENANAALRRAFEM